MNDTTNSVTAHYDAIAADYGSRYDENALITMDKYPANYFRLKMMIARMRELNAKRIFEVGTGEGTPLMSLADIGFDVWGCDISERMVEATRAKLVERGLPSERVNWGDVQNLDSMKLTDAPFDVVFAFGVLPHVSDDLQMLRNIRKMTAPNGKVFIEFRNALFSMFTMNRYTQEFIVNDLLGPVSDDVKSKVAAELEKRVAMDKPTPRLTTEDGHAPGYDAIRSTFHNPFEIPALFEQAGFRNPKLHWYHYHPAFPWMEAELGQAFRREGMAMEYETSGWRGYFLCSAAVVEADNCP